MSQTLVTSCIFALVFAWRPPNSGCDRREILVNITQFERVIQSAGYIDKTWFIYDFFRLPRFIMITGPQGFSKSTNLDMLKTYLEYELNEGQTPKDPEKTMKLVSFVERKIFTNQTHFYQHFAKYPVIQFDFSLVKSTNLTEFLKTFHEHCVDPLVTKYNYLLRSTKIESTLLADLQKQFSEEFQWNRAELVNFGATLAKSLHEHHGMKVIVLIDNYDDPISSAYLGVDAPVAVAGQVFEFISLFIALTIKTNCERAVLAGTLGLTLENEGEPLDLQHLPIFDSKEMYTSFGILEDDVKILQQQLNVPPVEAQIMRLYHCGYCIYDKLEDEFIIKPYAPKGRIYNTNSLLNFLRTRTLRHWWRFPAYAGSFKPLLTPQRYGTKFETCLLNQSRIMMNKGLTRGDLNLLKQSLISPGSAFTRDLVLQVFYESGYFTAVGKSGVKFYTLAAPNFEVQTKTMDDFYQEGYLQKRYGFSAEDEKKYTEAMDKLSPNVLTLRDLVQSVQNLFRKAAPEDKLYLQPVLLYPMLDTPKFATYRIEKYTNYESRYDIFARRTRDKAGITIDVNCGYTGPEASLQNIRYPRIFQQMPGLQDTIELRITVNNKTDVRGYYNYTIFTTKTSVCLTWPPQ